MSETIPHITFIHGWAMNSHVWDDVVQHLKTHYPQGYTLSCLDLPGHGKQAPLKSEHFNDWVELLVSNMPDRSHVVGWSLGGLLAQGIAQQYPDRVQSLLLLGSSPCFVQKADWPHAMQPEVLAQFAQQLSEDYQQTVKRFWALQFFGTKQSKTTRQLRDKVLSLPVDPASLQIGLQFLQQVDLRHNTQQHTHAIPEYWWLGEYDKLVPAQMLDSMEEHIKSKHDEKSPQSRVYCQPKAGHAVFLQDHDAFMHRLVDWIASVA